MGKSYGFVEITGVVAAIHAVDCMCKVSQVKLETWERKLGGRLVTIVVSGDISSVKEAVEAANLQGIRKPVASGVIASPHEEIRRLVELSAERYKGGSAEAGERTAEMKKGSRKPPESVKAEEEEAKRKLPETTKAGEEEGNRKPPESAKAEEEEAKRKLPESAKTEEEEANRKLQESTKAEEEEANRKPSELTKAEEEEAKRKPQESTKAGTETAATITEITSEGAPAKNSPKAWKGHGRGGRKPREYKSI